MFICGQGFEDYTGLEGDGEAGDDGCYLGGVWASSPVVYIRGGGGGEVAGWQRLHWRDPGRFCLSGNIPLLERALLPVLGLPVRAGGLNREIGLGWVLGLLDWIGLRGCLPPL